MIRLVKKIRNDYELRGYYSYILEGIIEIMWAQKKFPDQELKVYFDLKNVHHYKQENLFDVCFIQDDEDYFENLEKYINIESLKSEIKLNHYDLKIFPQEIREGSKTIMDKFLVLKQEYQDELENRLKTIDLSKTISVHRRDTDMSLSHGVYGPELQHFFTHIDNEEFEKIFVMSDNKPDLDFFIEKYGDKIISFENDTTSDNTTNPFFLNENISPEMMKKHIENLTLNTFILGKTKKLFCTKSNVSAFAILANPKLDYIKLN